MPPRRAAVLSAAILFVLASPLHAQLGGLTKKAKQKIIPTAEPTGSTDQPARLPGPEITKDVVDRFLTGLAAEKKVMDQEAADAKRREQDAEQAREADRARKQGYANQQECVDEKAKADPDYARLQDMRKQLDEAGNAGDVNKLNDLSLKMSSMSTALYQRVQTECAALFPAGAEAATPAQQAVQQAPAGQAEAAGAKAAGMTGVEYGQVKELLLTWVHFGKRAGLTAEETKVVEPRKKALQDGFKGIGA